MINVVSNEQQPTTPAAEARLGLRLSQAQQFRRRRNSQETPRRRRHQQLLEQQPEHRAVQQYDTAALARKQLTITSPGSFFASLLCTIILCLPTATFGSTLSPLAKARQFTVAFGAMAGTGNGDFTMVNGHHITEDAMTQVQQPRLKASTRAVPSTMPTVEQTMPRPTSAANPVSPPDNAADVTMRAESISPGSSSSTTVSGETMMNIEQFIWNNFVTNECAPMVRNLLDDADFYPISNMTTSDKLKTFADLGNTRPIQRDSFIPARWDNNQERHLWWTWLTEVSTGTVPGFKELHGDNVHRHHKFQNRPDHRLNQYIADGTVATRHNTGLTRQPHPWSSDNPWRTFDVLQWPMECTGRQFTFDEPKTFQ
eukprot:4115588-Amphidinium_carterae.1